ncbi:MAG: hypothetical protein AAFQ75_05890 [Pseudomonadota bacterium]
MTIATALPAPAIASNPGAPMFADLRFRVRTFLLLRRALGITAKPDEFSALALLCRRLRGMGGNAHDAAVGFAISRNMAVEPERLRAAAESAALKATRDQVKKYLKKPQARPLGGKKR